jgi:hypothetical protein
MNQIQKLNNKSKKINCKINLKLKINKAKNSNKKSLKIQNTKK